jgi:phospholipid/cholesterol/gamma-HCH transport system permease protein
VLDLPALAGYIGEETRLSASHRPARAGRALEHALKPGSQDQNLPIMSSWVSSFVKRQLLVLQEFTDLLVRACRAAFSRPRYYVDFIIQMDVIGVGSLPIVLLIGFFTGGILALQAYRTLQTFGEVGLMGHAVSLSVVAELGPVLTALMVTGRNGSAMASEIGSMLVSEQVDALRALGTDPLRKLVAPRLYATVCTLPLLTVLADFMALLGGYLVSVSVTNLTTEEYWTSAYQALGFHDVTEGLIKPLIFAVVIASVGCYSGLNTTGGTEGVGRATTRAMVVASVLILILDFFIDKFLIGINFI